MAERAISHYSTFLDRWAALVGIPSDRITTEIAAVANVGFQNAIEKMYDDASWLEISPYGEARFLGNRLGYPNNLSESDYWDALNLGGNATVTNLAVATISNPAGLALDSSGNLYIANNGNGTIRKRTPLGVVTTFASGLNDPYGLAFDSGGNLFVSNLNGGNINRITPGGVVTDLGLSFGNPAGLAFDASDNLYVAEQGNTQISKVTPVLTVSVFCSGLSDPTFLVWDAAYTFLYSSNQNGLTIDKISTGGVATDLGLAFSNPTGLVFDTDGNLYVACEGDGTIILVTPGLATITYATGLGDPTGLAITSTGLIYESEYNGVVVNSIAAALMASVTLTPNSIPNPADGRVTTTKMMEVAVLSKHGVKQEVTNFYPNTTYTASFYARPNGRAWQYIEIYDGQTTYTGFFNTATGQVGTNTGFTSFTMGQQPNGFWQCQAVFTTGTTTTTDGYYQLLLSPDGSTLTYTGVTTVGAYFWGALLQQSSNTPVQDLLLPWNQLGEESIDALFNVWPCPPFANNFPSQFGFNLLPEGAQIINGTPYQYTIYFNGVAQNNLYGAPPNNPIFIYYRKDCPSFSGDVYDATETYDTGDQVYFTTSKGKGDFYKALDAVAVAETPETNPELWERITLYTVFLEYCVYQAFSDWLVSDGNIEKSLAMSGVAESKMGDAFDKFYRQMDTGAPMKMSTHLTSRPAY